MARTPRGTSIVESYKRILEEEHTIMKPLSAEPLYKVILFLFRKVWNRRDLTITSITESDKEE
jgi:hypothetical protein